MRGLLLLRKLQLLGLVAPEEDVLAAPYNAVCNGAILVDRTRSVVPLSFVLSEVDHVFGDGDVTYWPELSGDLDNFFLMTPNTTDNIWKIPYHHIKSYMDQAGLSKGTGKWDIRSEGK